MIQRKLYDEISLALYGVISYGKGRRPQFRLLAKYIHKTVRTDTDRARCDWLLLMIKYWWAIK